jgi:hypothetical protein
VFRVVRGYPGLPLRLSSFAAALIWIQGRNIALNRTCSHLIRVNRTILKHFFIGLGGLDGTGQGSGMVCLSIWRRPNLPPKTDSRPAPGKVLRLTGFAPKLVGRKENRPR